MSEFVPLIDLYRGGTLECRHFGAIAVVDTQGQARGHRREHLVEVVAIDLDELAILHTRKRVTGVAGEIAHDSEHERQLLELDGAADLDVVRDLDPGGPDSFQFLLDAFFLGHTAPSPLGLDLTS